MTWIDIYQRPFTLRETKRRRRREIEIPSDVVEEILMRLPVASICRFQVVSKQWGRWIRSKGFKQRYMAYQKTKESKLLLLWDDLVDRVENALHLKTMALEATSTSLEVSHTLKYETFKGYLELSESCDGLVCIYASTIAAQVMNPVTTMFIPLPLAKIQRVFLQHGAPEAEPEQDPSRRVPAPAVTFTRFGFGKDSLTGRYKLVWLYNKYPTPCEVGSKKKKKVRCEVLDLHSQERRWRFVSTTPLDHLTILYNQRPAFANGCFYWLTGDEEGDPTTQTKLIVFDIHTEMFEVSATPGFIAPDAPGIGLCNLNGRLCISELKGDCKQEFWWMVKGAWEKIFTVDLRSTSTWFRGITSEPLTPLAITRDNKVILSLYSQENLVAFDLHPDSRAYHLYFHGYYGLAVPYFPSFVLE